MRKETRKERIVVDTYQVYIAVDGKEFDNEKECLEHEKNLRLEELEEEVKKFAISQYEGIPPIYREEDHYNASYYWYVIKNEETYSILREYYELEEGSDMDYFSEPDAYPAVVCVEVSYDWCETHYLKRMINFAKSYFTDSLRIPIEELIDWISC